MLAILLNFSYLFLTAYMIGAFWARRFGRLLRYEGGQTSSVYLASGLMLATVYAQVFSLFGGVGLLANGILAAACLFFLWLDRDFYWEQLKKLKTVTPLAWILGAALVLAIAFFCSDGSFMYDTGLYHAQSIRWIEDYGAVKGIANIHERLGYNSAFFSLAALYSMKWLFGGQSLHAVQGFSAAFLLVDSLLGLYGRIRRKEKLLTAGNFCRLGPAVYTVLNLTELISPTTDYMTVYMIMWLVTRWADLIEEGEKEIFPYAYLCIIAVYVVSLKLSAGLLVLLALKPAVRLIREKKGRDILIYILTGFCVILPYLIRNVIVSGWLVYPYAAIDLFPVDWKLARGTVVGDAMDIKLWGRGLYDRDLIDQTVFQWFPTWWAGLSASHRYFLLAVFAALVLEAVYAVWLLAGIKKRGLLAKMGDYLFLEAVLTVCFLFWLLSAPIPRYGFAFIIMVSLLAVGVSFEGEKRGAARIFPVFCALFVGALMLKPTLYAVRDDLLFGAENLKDYAYLVMQKDYPNPGMKSEDLNGITIYYPEEAGGQSWYYAFPATNFGENIQYWENRGEGIRDGFRQKYPENAG